MTCCYTDKEPKHMNLYILPLTVSSKISSHCISLYSARKGADLDKFLTSILTSNLNHSIAKYVTACFFNLAFIYLDKVQLPKEMRQGNKAELLCLCLLNLR